MRVRLSLAVGVLLASACGSPPEPRPPVNQPLEALRPTEEQVRRVAEQFGTLETGFLEWYHDAYPVRATNLGIHEADGRLPAQDRQAIQERIDDLLDWLAQVERVPLTMLEDARRFDYAVLEFAIRGELLTLEEVRPWANDPRHYTGLVADGLASVAIREYAPVGQRARSIAARMREALLVLEAARTNLRRPPRLWTEVAIADTRGLMAWLEALPEALSAQGGGEVVGEVIASEAAALMDALDAHVAWLESDLLPRSNGDFRLGPYLFQRKLLYDEHVNLSVEELDRLNEQKIAEYQEWVARTAAEIDPSRTPRAIMDSLTAVHPFPEELIPTARSIMLEARDWLRASGVVPLPTDEVPQVVETPPYRRGGFASMDAPGPFSEAGLEAYYYITNVDPDWTEEQKQQHLTYFNYPGLLGVTVHETFPGHFVQLAYMRDVESRIRRTFVNRSLTEGWAHYAEQMALDEGFRDGDPAVRLGQLRRALQRHARWYAGLHLHAMGASIEEVVPRFMELAYFDEFPARREVVRATYDPTYLYYALGRMQILELREDYQAYLAEREGEFSLPGFHQRLLELGLPISLATEAMLSPPRGPQLDPSARRRRY